MFKWFVGLILLISILSSPINQNASSDSNGPSISNNTSIYMDFAKGAAKNILFTTNTILEILIENMDKPSATPSNEKIDLQNL